SSAGPQRRRDDVRGRPQGVLAAGPEHHHGGRDPRSRDRVDRHQGGVDRPPRALHAAHQRCALDGDAHGGHGHRAVQRGERREPDRGTTAGAAYLLGVQAGAQVFRGGAQGPRHPVSRRAEAEVLQGQRLRHLRQLGVQGAPRVVRGHGPVERAAAHGAEGRLHGGAAGAGGEGRDAHAAHGRHAEGEARHHHSRRSREGDRGMTAGASQVVNLRSLLEEMIEKDASDLHIVAGERPKLRVDGDIVSSGVEAVLTPKDTLSIAYSVLTENQKKRFETENELDFSFGIQNLARFRGNVFKQRGCVSMVIRQIPFTVKTFDDLGLPQVVAKLAEKPRGLVLVTGPTGSGKSTTLAAMIDKVNKELKGHLITVEDPIEFIHRHQACIVNQREIGTDTNSFAAALKYALRQDPDVVLVGEMRDLETIGAALTIAETGHLAFATLHTNSAMESINRIIDVFPSHQQAQVRAQLSFVLEGIVTQTLLQKAKGKGRVMACEILIMTPAVRALIRDEKIEQIPSMMQAGKKHGMQTLNDALYQLYVSREVTKDECLRVTSTPNEFLRMIGEAPMDDKEPTPSAGQPVGAGKVAARR